MDATELLKNLRGALASRHRPPAGALVSFALEPRAGRSGLISCVWEFSDESRADDVRPSADYGPALLLGDEWIDGPTDAVDQFEALLKGNGFLKGHAVQGRCEGSAWIDRVLPTERSNVSVGNYTGWPEVAYAADLASTQVPQVHQGPIVRHGLRPFSNKGAAACEWVWGELGGPFGREMPHVGRIVAILPDTRGRIATAEWREGRVKVKVEPNVPPMELELQLLAHSTTGPTTVHVVTDEWPVSEDCGTIELFLVHVSGDLLGHLKLERPGTEYSADARGLTLTEQVELDLRGGENEHVEYKPFVEPGHEKEVEIVRAVIAFANSEGGGRLYVGVDDRGTPERRAALSKAFKGDPRQAEESLENHVRKLVRERIKPVPDVELQRVEVFGERVLLVRVQQGDDPPYSTQEGNEVFMRKGASNKRPDPKTELPALLERGRDQRRRVVFRPVGPPFGESGPLLQ